MIKDTGSIMLYSLKIYLVDGSYLDTLVS